MGTTAYGGKGSKGRAANCDRPVGAASCRRDDHTMASCQNPQRCIFLALKLLVLHGTGPKRLCSFVMWRFLSQGALHISL